MQSPDPSNKLFQLASSYVNHTGKHIFLTGKAGTGKTTFLKYIREQTQKNTIVVAPTGVAAIHAGGATIHSVFQLPLASFLPVHNTTFAENGSHQAFNKHSIFSKVRLSKEKIALLQALELLIIDEVSMVRCDILDAIDTVLRHYRKNMYDPFGGVQVLYIGDLFQLPPVVPPYQWSLLRDYYNSPFFFDSHVIIETPPIYIELKKIYRQKEERFVNLLNNIRNNEVHEEDLHLLNQSYRPGFRKDPDDKTITLTTHNYKAERINQFELEKLPGTSRSFEASVSGDFPEHIFPADQKLRLKEGAQIMFLKNDASKRFYNGKLGTVKMIQEDAVIIKLNEDESEVMLEKEVWKNIRYSYNQQSGKIIEEEIGSFTQYPIKLAWAVTIHKSQGLTFDKVIIDAGASFAPGQVYVALSRCTTLDGIVLQSPIHHKSIMTDERVIAFARQEAGEEELASNLSSEQLLFLTKHLKTYFNPDTLSQEVNEMLSSLPDRKIPEKEEAEKLYKTLLAKIEEQKIVAGKFERQLHSFFQRDHDNLQSVLERVNAAIHYFSAFCEKELLDPLQEHLGKTQSKKKVRKYCKAVKELMTGVDEWRKKLPFAKELLEQHIHHQSQSKTFTLEQ